VKSDEDSVEKFHDEIEDYKTQIIMPTRPSNKVRMWRRCRTGETGLQLGPVQRRSGSRMPSYISLKDLCFWVTGTTLQMLIEFAGQVGGETVT
jgi:hypothetical protein